MKTKLITGAIIGATLFGGALSVSAANVVDNVGTTDIGVDIVEPEEGKELLTLMAVPTNYIFESVVTQNGKYALAAKQIGDTSDDKGVTNNEIKVHKNYSTVGKYEVRAKVSDLTLKRAGTDPVTVGVDSFAINNIGVLGTGNAKVLYTDNDFAGESRTTGSYSQTVTRATIGFEKADLKPSDELTGTITYTIGTYTPPTP